MRFILTTSQLRQKIMQVKTAIIHCAENSFFNFQSVFAQTIRVDDNRVIWLLPGQVPACGAAPEPGFEVILNYHKQGLSFDLDVLGQATIISGDAIKEMGGEKYRRESNDVLLRVEITDVDYWEQASSSLKDIVMTRFPRSSSINAEPK